MPVQYSVPLGPLWQLATYMVPPVIKFGAPVQRGKGEHEAFWHVPITIRPKLWGKIGPATLHGAEIYLDEFSGDKVTNKIRLCWGDAKLENPETTAFLRRRHTVLVPVAYRSEKDAGGTGFIADTRFFAHGEKAIPVPADRRKHRYKLRVKCGTYERHSPGFYVLRVPRTASNSHFALEVEYDGGGTSSDVEPAHAMEPAPQPPQRRIDAKLLMHLNAGYSGRTEDPVIVSGQHVGMAEKLRVYVDWNNGQVDGPPPQHLSRRVHLTDLIGGINGKNVAIPVFRPGPSGGYLWGDGTEAFSNGPISNATMFYCRLVIIDDQNKGEEQRFYFNFMAPATNVQRPFLFRLRNDPAMVAKWDEK